MRIQASEIFAAFSQKGVLLEHVGGDAEATGLAAATECGPGDLVFVDREAFVAPVLERKASVVVTKPDLAPAFADAPGVAVLVTPNVTLARALLMQQYFDRELRPGGGEPIHPSATVHETAQIHPSARVGPGVVLERDAVVGADSVLLANVVVEEGAVIGERTVIHPAVVIGFQCEIGSRVIIRAGTIIGSEGFGFAQDEKRRNHRIPQLGKVVVEDRVVIGANCCIDRGTHGATRVGAGTIMDNLCHVAHNVQIGEDCILTAMLCVAGSTRLGDRVLTSGMVGILDHLSVADDVYLLQRAGVATDVKEPGAYAGVPLQPLKEYRRTMASLRKLPQIRDAVRELAKRVETLESAR